MKILLLNDDGIKSKGLKVLAEALKGFGELYIFAPETHQSGKSQALTIRKYMKVKDYGSLYGSVKAYSAKGTPADCARLALYIFDDIEFDFVISGVNQGANIGVDVLHSGTLGAASEAAGLGIPAVAVSAAYSDFSMAEKYLSPIIKYLLEKDLIKSDYVLNINFPSDKFKEPKGIMFTTQGKNIHQPAFKKKRFNRYMATFNKIDINESEDSDVYCYYNGIISITPVFEDRSNKKFNDELNKKNKSKLNEVIIYDKIK